MQAQLLPSGGSTTWLSCYLRPQTGSPAAADLGWRAAQRLAGLPTACLRQRRSRQRPALAAAAREARGGSGLGGQVLNGTAGMASLKVCDEPAQAAAGPRAAGAMSGFSVAYLRAAAWPPPTTCGALGSPIRPVSWGAKAFAPHDTGLLAAPVCAPHSLLWHHKEQSN